MFHQERFSHLCSKAAGRVVDKKIHAEHDRYPDSQASCIRLRWHSRRGCSNPTRFRERPATLRWPIKPGVEPPLANEKGKSRELCGHWVGWSSLVVFHG